LSKKYLIGDVYPVGKAFLVKNHASKDEEDRWVYKPIRYYDSLSLDTAEAFNLKKEYEGSFKLTLDNDSLLDFIKDDVLKTIKSSHQIKVLKDDLDILKKASTIASKF